MLANQNKECSDGFNSCSLSMKKSDMGSWLGWSLGALGLALWFRRKRSV